MARRDEEQAPWKVPRPDYMREIEPGPLDRLHTESTTPLDIETAVHNRKLMERACQQEREEKAG